MKRIKDTVFYVGLGALMTHELDAMTNHEWRVLPLIRELPDDLARIVFVAAHVPLFAVVVAWIASTAARTRLRARVAVATFLVLHGGLHAIYTGHESYEFASPLSNTLIFGGAVFGAVYLLLERGTRHGSPT
jgi:hypothetical protein